MLTQRTVKNQNCDILILDEVNNAIQLQLVDLQQVKDILFQKPVVNMHIILTGRDAPPEIIALADTVSEVCEIKHTYQQEIEPQSGIDHQTIYYTVAHHKVAFANYSKQLHNIDNHINLCRSSHMWYNLRRK